MDNIDPISGHPLGDLEALHHKPAGNGLLSSSSSIALRGGPRSPANISFVRNRMLYARATLNAQGRIRFGLKHIRKALTTLSGYC